MLNRRLKIAGNDDLWVFFENDNSYVDGPTYIVSADRTLNSGCLKPLPNVNTNEDAVNFWKGEKALRDVIYRKER